MPFYCKKKITFICYFTIRNTILCLCILCITIKSTGTWKIVVYIYISHFLFSEGHSLKAYAEVSDG